MLLIALTSLAIAALLVARRQGRPARSSSSSTVKRPNSQMARQQCVRRVHCGIFLSYLVLQTAMQRRYVAFGPAVARMEQ